MNQSFQLFLLAIRIKPGKELRMREIDITKQDIRCWDVLLPNEDNSAIEATYELWFDVDAYFGTNTKNDEVTWINFYTAWYPETDEIKAHYVVDREHGMEKHEWELTNEEKEFFKSKMEQYCHQIEKCSLYELWNKISVA